LLIGVSGGWMAYSALRRPSADVAVGTVRAQPTVQ
jgi:hypothetical protein